MKTFSMFFSEDAGEKFNKMDDDQFANWKKANPGAAEKADKLRSAKKESGLQKNDAKKELPTSAITAPKGGALAKHRKSEMGKWSAKGHQERTCCQESWLLQESWFWPGQESFQCYHQA